MSETASCARYGAGGETGLRDLPERFVQRGPRDPVAGLDELRELHRVDGLRVDAGEPVRDHICRRHGLGACDDCCLPEPVEAAGDEDDGAVEIEVGLDPPDPPGWALRHLRAQPFDQIRGRLDRDEVGLGEVAVVVSFLLRPARL